MTTTDLTARRDAGRKKKPLVYIASPCTKGDRLLNIKASFAVWDRLRRDGLVVPYAPLTDEAIQLMYRELSYDAWLDFDLDILPHCDAVLRVDAVLIEANSGLPIYQQSCSKGADREVKFAKSIDIPVFRTIETLYVWAGARELRQEE